MRVKGIKCPRCWDCLYSEHRHDFRYCFCGHCFVDGGSDYLRYGWTPGPTGSRPEEIEIDTDRYIKHN